MVESRPEGLGVNEFPSSPAELLSHAPKDFVQESLILHGASQHDATDHRRHAKDGFFPVPSFSSEQFSREATSRA